MTNNGTDTVTITCYGHTDTQNRDDAIAFYNEAAYYCEGSERQRYLNILTCLYAGDTVITDGVDD